MGKVAIFCIINPKDATHTNVLKITQTKICHPHVFGHQFCKRNAIEIKHIFHGFNCNILLEFAVLIEIGICKFLSVFHTIFILKSLLLFIQIWQR